MKRLTACILSLILLCTVLPLALAEEEYTLEREEGTNQLTFYWTADDADYETCDMWIWYPNADGHGYLFHPCAYGVKVVLNVPKDITRVGFIVRRACSDPGGSSWGSATKDFEADRYAEITGETTEIYLRPRDGIQYHSNDGGKTLYEELTFGMAGIIAPDQIQYTISPAARFTSLEDVQVCCDGREVPVASLSSLNNNVITGVITLSEALDISKPCTVTLRGYGEKAAVPTRIFDSDAFISEYTYDGDDLGSTVLPDEKTCFRLWAPTATAVELKLFEQGDGGEAYLTLPMEYGEKGVWSVTAPCGHGTYYTYLVTTGEGTKETVDPYARSAGVNGNRGMVTDLKQTDPEGFENDAFISGIGAYNEAVIWEVHVRDFSNRITSSAYPGKYLAFTEHGLTNEAGEPVGLDYLTDLGITHVHLQPVYDYATVDESNPEAQFNWGYDPKNYNVPEGSYSTDPYYGEVRIREFKQMVQALHSAGLGVIMDVVYNHTFDADSCLSRTVPYYYYRYNGLGELSNGSGCGNETASERIMCRKYIVDSVTYWAREYHVDGFRFDLMALHDVETMQAVEQAVHAINPCALIYGEGWTGGTSALSLNLQATQGNIRQVKPSEGAIGGIAVFNDAIRDGLKGSVFDANDRGYISGQVSKGTANRVIFGLTGGAKMSSVSWWVENNAVINYMACHDNNTLWDKLAISNAAASKEERLRMNRFGTSIIMIGKGIPFFLAGEEMLRTKGGDHNSYASPDGVNNLDWDALVPGSDEMAMRDFYRALIALRKANPWILQSEVACTLLTGNVIEVRYTLDGKETGLAVINPTVSSLSYELTGSWEVLLCGDTVTADAPQALESGSVQVPARGVLLLRSTEE